MRKVSAFSAKMSNAPDSKLKRETFTEHNTQAVSTPQGQLEVYMTPSLVKQNIREMKRSINVRFLQLIKSCKSYARSVKDPGDMAYLRKFMVMQLTMMLGEYVDLLQSNPSLQIATYLKINSVCPQAKDSARILSRVMIMANRIRRSSGVLPPKNQRDLNRAMDQFINDVIGVTTQSINVKSPFLNNSLTNQEELTDED